MSQVSYGTITITDMNDIEEIYTIYAGSNTEASPTFTYTAVTDGTTWKRNASALSGFKYIWQSTVVTKSGVTINSINWQEFYSQPVRLTGLEGNDANNISAIETQYCNYGEGTPTASANWQSTTPEYDSSKPNYWSRTRLKYDTSPITYSSWSNPIKDQALTDAIYNAVVANSIAQQTIEDAQGAMSQAASNVNEVKRIWYAQAAATPVPNAPTTGVTTSVTHDAWSITKPVADESYQYYFYCDQTKTGGGVYSWSEVILDTSTLSQYQIGAMSAKVRNYWWDSAGAHIASGISASSGSIDATSPTSAYGYNTLTGLTGISFRYNDAKVVDLNSEVPSLDFYTPPVIENNLVTANGKLAMRLSKNSLNFYNPEDGETLQASLSTNGLIIQNGSIRLGNSSSNIAGSITLSNQNFSRNINNTTREDLRFAIGSNFGVKDNGTLYASNVDIEGAINVNDELNSNIYTKEEVNSGLENAAATATNFIKTSIDGSGIQIAAQNASAYLLITDKVLRFYLNDNVMSQFGYDEIFESYGVQAENIFIKGAGNALRLDNNVNGTYQGQYILETRANGHLSLKPGLRRTEEE